MSVKKKKVFLGATIDATNMQALADEAANLPVPCKISNLLNVILTLRYAKKKK